jgi:hypothetical protein
LWPIRSTTFCPVFARRRTPDRHPRTTDSYTHPTHSYSGTPDSHACLTASPGY